MSRGKINKTVRTKKAKSPKASKPSKNNKFINVLGEIDYSFLFLIFLLLSFGLVMLLSASTPSANTKIGDSYYFFIRQLGGVIIGGVMMVFFTMFDYHLLKRFIGPAFIILLVALVCCRIPGIGVFRNGAWRWLRTPLIQLQPSEFMKPAIAILFAKYISERKYKMHTLTQVAYPYGMWLVVIFLIMWGLQSHVSGAIVIIAIGVMVMIVGGVNLKLAIIPSIAVAIFALVYIPTDPMRLGRIMSFLDPFRDVSDKSYQITQSLIAIGTGGLFGKGLGQSVQKYGFLPEPYNDFIFAIVFEELGLIGGLLIIALFVLLIARGLKIAREAPDTFGMLTVVGIISHIAIQTVFNIAVVSCSMPTTGISLPFFSYGGTAVMVLVAEMGIVLNVSRQSKKLKTLPD